MRKEIAVLLVAIMMVNTTAVYADSGAAVLGTLGGIVIVGIVIWVAITTDRNLYTEVMDKKRELEDARKNKSGDENPIPAHLVFQADSTTIGVRFSF